MTKSFKLKLIIIHCIIPLLLGGLVYVLFRSTELRMFYWFSNLGLEYLIHFLREMFSHFNHHLPDWLFYSIPDGLWVYSFTSALLIIWECRLTIWLFLPLISGPFVEIAQLAQISPGTFDVLDLIFTLVGYTTSFILITYNFTKTSGGIGSRLKLGIKKA